ncbi:MAG: NAD(P)H-dependent oxidoreductase subunit E [Phaeodactylibacter sp.]|nr:NAD(P)H-dependent oxidoreductase subunit E [Phaeodactylibacter sp.]MCB9303269.1 NAD(P)H-dependent oxidoreductase subunit E [Lewinellaceae bacterium]
MQVDLQVHQRANPDLLDCLWAYQNKHGYIRDEDVAEFSAYRGISKVELEGVISFYHFFHRKPAGRYTIYLNNSIVSEFSGFQRVKEAFERETGAAFGEVDPSGLFGLFETACIGLSDQEPAALINFHPFTNLTTMKVKHIIAELKKGVPVEKLCDEVADNIRYVPGEGRSVFLREYFPGSAIAKLQALSPEQVIDEINRSKLSGRGGAFFPTGLKWGLCRQQESSPKYIVCNADEGEPGTFKDRVLLNTMPGLVLEGMIIAGYAVGASVGMLYLRAEYTWMKDKLEKAIEQFYRMGLLGLNAAGIKGFNFDIRLQLGAGSYVIGEETAMLNSLEGKRGESRVKQYFPVEKGYLNQPTVVNNVETLCAAARVMELGADHFLKLGTPDSPGTKLLSISGDCHLPGIYEIEWGMRLEDLLQLCQAENPYYIQVSGPSGECVSMAEKNRVLSKEDLRCGGSLMIFSGHRDILDILINFADFFKEESCGVCTPCRAGNFIIRRKLEKVRLGLAHQSDYEDIRQWGKIMQIASRCGLGKMATNALIKALDAFPEYFNQKIEGEADRLNKEFNIERAVADYEKFRS